MPLLLSPHTTHSIFWFLSLFCEPPDWLLFVPGVVLCCSSLKPEPTLEGTRDKESSGTDGVRWWPRTGSRQGWATSVIPAAREKPRSSEDTSDPGAWDPPAGEPWKNPEPAPEVGGPGHKPPTRHTARALCGIIMVSRVTNPGLRRYRCGFLLGC